MQSTLVPLRSHTGPALVPLRSHSGPTLFRLRSLSKSLSSPTLAPNQSHPGPTAASLGWHETRRPGVKACFLGRILEAKTKFNGLGFRPAAMSLRWRRRHALVCQATSPETGLVILTVCW